MRFLAALAILALVPSALAAQADTNFTGWLRFRSVEPLELREPALFRSPWAGSSRPLDGEVGAAWDSALVAYLDSVRASRATAWRLRRIYGKKAAEAEAAADSVPGDRGVLGLSRRYADLNMDGQARLEVRTERLKNLRCTPAQFLDLNSGCRGGFKAPRLDTYLAMRAGGLIGRRLHVDVDYDTERDFTARNNIQVYYQGLEDEIVRRVEVGTVTFRPPPSRFVTANIPANNFGVNATFEVGPLQLQTIAATQKGSVVAERTYTVGSTTVQPQDREARDLDYEASRFFWVVDPATLPGYPALDVLQIDRGSLPPAAQINQADVRVYRYRPPSRTGVNPNLGGINAVAIGVDPSQRVTALWEPLQRDLDFYVDRSGVWIALAAKLDQNDYLAVSYRTAAGQVGTFPAVDTPVPPGTAPRDTLLLIVQPRVDASQGTFRFEMRQIYRVAGADLDRSSLQVNLSLNRSERPLRPGAQATYLAELGLATAADPSVFNLQDRLFPRVQDPAAALTIKESYVVFPSLMPFDDPAHLLATERNDSLYRTPDYLLLTEGPPAKFVFRLRYNASSSGDRSSLNLGALQLRDGSEVLFLNGRRLEKGVDYNINYDLGQVDFINPQALFGNGGGTVQARFEERGIFAVAPTSIFGVSTRYNLGDVGGINLTGIYQVEQSAFNRPQLGFEASANMVGGLSTDLKFKPEGVTRFLNRLTSTPATAPSRLDINAEVALTRPDPNRSGQAYLEEFEGDPGVPLSLRESVWEFGSRPQFADGVQQIVGQVFDTADAAQLTWQNLVVDRSGQVSQLRARDIDNQIQVAGQQDQLETVLFMALQPDTAGGQVRNDTRLRWTLPTRLNAPRWRSMVTSLSPTGVDLSKNEFLEFWVFNDTANSVSKAGVSLVVDLGSVSEDAVAMAPESLAVSGPDSTFRGRQFVGFGRLDTEREANGVFNAAGDDIGILGDRPDVLVVNGAPEPSVPLCQRQLTNVVQVFPWGDLGSRCTNGNGTLDTEDLDNDNNLNASGSGEDVLRWVVDLRNSPYFVREGVQSSTDSSGWKLYRLPLRTPEFSLGSPNIRLVKHLRITVVAQPDNNAPDLEAFFALARMRFLGAPWARRSDRPVSSLAGATSASTGDVVASTVSTENTELGYVSPPGVRGGLNGKGGSQGEFGTQINERSLRVLAKGIGLGQRAEAYFRFPSGPQNLLRYRELRAWLRGRGPGWDNHDFVGYLRVGSDSRNFYEYRTQPVTTTWEPELRVDLGRWRSLRAKIESRRLQGLPADSAARVACGGDTVSVAYVLCDGPYLVYIEDPAVNPPNLAQVQELAAGIIRVGTADPTPDAELWVDDIRLVDPISRVGSAMAVDARLAASDVAEFSGSYIRQDGYFQQIGQQPTYQTTGTLQLGSGVRLDRFLPASFGIVMPAQVSYARSDVAPQLLTGTDIEGKDLTALRRPLTWSLAYNVSVRRAQRGKNWLTRGLIDPLTLSASFTSGRNVSELSSASSSSHDLNAQYNLTPGRTGMTLDLGGLVDHLPGFLRNSDGGAGLRRPFLSLAPSSVRLASGLTRTQSDLLAYDVPVQRAADSLIVPVTALQHLWRNSAGLSWQPLGMLGLSADLASTRDLRQYPDSTPLGRLASASRRSFLGLDAGVERDRQFNTALNLNPRLASWLRPRYLTGSNFILSRSLASRSPIREDGDTAGAFILPQTLNNSRFNEIGASLEIGRLLGRIFGDSSVLGRATRRIRGFDVSDRITRNSTFDLAAFDPGLSYQLGLGGLGSFLTQGSDSAVGAAEVRNTTFTTGADLPEGISFTSSYTRARTSRFQRTAGGFLTTETLQREWPKGTVRLTRTLRNFPITVFGLGASYRNVEGSSTIPSLAGPPVTSRNTSTNLTPDAQLTLRNGMVFTFSYNMLNQESEASGNLTRVNQDDFTASFNHAFQLPASISRARKTVRSQLSAVLSKSTTCLRQGSDPSCQGVADTRRQEFRASLDADLARIMTGGINASYSVTDVRNLDRKVSQIIITASLQLSLFAGDYR